VETLKPLIMKLRINKNVLGEEYRFYGVFTPKSYSCVLNLASSNTLINGVVSEDFKTITLSEPLTLKGYGEAIQLRNGGILAGYGESKSKIIKSLKLSKINSIKVKEYILCQ
jgi:hypothetical protein